MSGWNAQPDGDSAGAAWRSLSGDALPQPPQLSAQAQQPWQDEYGQWHSPFAATQPEQAPPYDPAALVVAQPAPHEYAMPLQHVVPVAPTVLGVPEPEVVTTPFVPAEELAPVGPPRYLAPARPAQDPRRRTMAAVITFVSLLIALWAILAFMGSMSRTLSSVSSGTDKLVVQLGEANAGLAELDTKTSHLEKMSADTKALASLLGTIDKDMGSMLGNVDKIAAGMTSMNGSLTSLQGEVSTVNDINANMSDKLGGISRGLGSQVASVRTMRRDVQATGTVLGTLPGRLNATNGRLAHVNNSVNTMGTCGITNQLEVTIGLGPLSTGSAKVYATVIPPMSWGRKVPGVTPC